MLVTASRSLRNRLALGCAVAVLLTTVGLTAARADTVTASLEPGQSAFWSGPFITSAQVPSPEVCNVAGPCYTYKIRVQPGRAQDLRVALGWHSDRDSYELQLFDPSGKSVGDVTALGDWAVEAFAPKPLPGVWTARVVPFEVSSSQFRMRARLDLPVKATGKRLLLPNIQVNPPWDVTLTGPIPLGGYGSAGTSDVAGTSLWSCSPDETAMHGAQRCLRFSTGPENTGAGPYEAHFDVAHGEFAPPDPSDPAGPGVYSGSVTQRIYYSDGTYTERNAGRWEFHAVHGHYHVQNMLSYKLFRVVDRSSGRMRQVGTGAKASFCTLDLAMIRWQSFTTQPARWQDPASCFPRAGTTVVDMGITPGWSDVYTWDLSDQYVDFAAGRDGYYVIQVEANPNHTVLTSNPNDNFGYALVRIQSDQVHMIERGQGRSPWDPHKVLFDPLGP